MNKQDEKDEFHSLAEKPCCTAQITTTSNCDGKKPETVFTVLEKMQPREKWIVRCTWAMKMMQTNKSNSDRMAVV